MVHTQSENIWAFDVLKFTLAIIIVSLHAGVANSFTIPWSECVRNLQDLAVPCFFVISAILFFRKVKVEVNCASQWRRLWKYEKRLIVLYLIWQAILLPVTLMTHDYSGNAVQMGLLYLKDLVFSYTFPASWFFGALIVAMPLVFLFRKHRWILLLISISLYVLFMTKTQQPLWIQDIYDWYKVSLAEPRLSFPEALIWLSLGCFMADYDELKVGESLLIRCMSGGGIFLSILINWCQAVGVVALLSLFLSCEYPNGCTGTYTRMRKYSTLFYCMHFTIIHILWQVIPADCHIIVWLVTIAICFILSETVLFMSKKTKFSFLNYLM